MSTFPVVESIVVGFCAESLGFRLDIISRQHFEEEFCEGYLKIWYNFYEMQIFLCRAMELDNVKIQAWGCYFASKD